VTVTDNIPPVVSGCPANITVPATTSCNAIVSWTPPTFADNCAGGTISSNKSPGSTFSKGTTVVTYTATDAVGNTATCSFNVTVGSDATLAFNSCVDEIIVQPGGNCAAVVSWTEPTLINNCGAISINRTHSPGDEFPVGSTTVTYTARDESLNEVTCSFNVIVGPVTPPVLTGCPQDIRVEGNEDGTAEATWSMPEIQVACGNSTTESSHAPGDKFSVGTTSVTIEVRDDFGNKSNCTFNVIVSPPEVSLEIAQIVTPDGNGINDIWHVGNIEKFKNRVVIFDRWGNVIFEADNYNNSDVSWSGLNASGSKVPTGTYFYSISILRGPTNPIKRSGFIELVQ
jgi:gliding motility-associated-like protein